MSTNALSVSTQTNKKKKYKKDISRSDNSATIKKAMTFSKTLERKMKSLVKKNKMRREKNNEEKKETHGAHESQAWSCAQVHQFFQM